MVVLIAASLVIGISINQFLDDGIPWRLLIPAGGRPPRVRYMDVESAFEAALPKNAVFLDVRSPSEFGVDRIPGAVSAPFGDFFRHPSDFTPADRTMRIVVYDFEPGSRKARLAAQWLVRRGYSNTVMLYPGLSGWIETGKPVEKGGMP
jgi:rhodanese-related sulfurtransferase